MQRDRFLAARTWLRVAAEDLKVAQAITGVSASRSAFHAQQAAESSLKAASIAISDDHQRTHSLRLLLRELETFHESVPDGIRADALSLELLYTTTRYPDALSDGDPEEYFDVTAAYTALDRARRINAYAEEIVDRVSRIEPDTADDSE